VSDPWLRRRQIGAHASTALRRSDRQRECPCYAGSVPPTPESGGGEAETGQEDAADGEDGSADQRSDRTRGLVAASAGELEVRCKAAAKIRAEKGTECD
jgi:hypothetical protein